MYIDKKNKEIFDKINKEYINKKIDPILEPMMIEYFVSRK
jgi:hypothetical protein